MPSAWEPRGCRNRYTRPTSASLRSARLSMYRGAPTSRSCLLRDRRGLRGGGGEGGSSMGVGGSGGAQGQSHMSSTRTLPLPSAVAGSEGQQRRAPRAVHDSGNWGLSWVGSGCPSSPVPVDVSDGHRVPEIGRHLQGKGAPLNPAPRPAHPLPRSRPHPRAASGAAGSALTCSPCTRCSGRWLPRRTSTCADHAPEGAVLRRQPPAPRPG